MIPRLAVLLSLPSLMVAQAVLPGSTQSPPTSQTHYSDQLFSPGETEGAAALSGRQKARIRLERIVEPRVFAGYLFIAGLQQVRNDPKEWGRGFDGFGKRYGTDLGANVVRQVVEGGLDAVTHEDPRFFRSSKTGYGPRLKDALMQVLVAHTDSGGRNLAYGNVLGAYGAGEAVSRWLPHSKDTVGDGLLYGTVLLAGEAGRNVFREFWPDVRRKMKHE